MPRANLLRLPLVLGILDEDLLVSSGKIDQNLLKDVSYCMSGIYRVSSSFNDQDTRRRYITGSLNGIKTLTSAPLTLPRHIVLNFDTRFCAKHTFPR